VARAVESNFNDLEIPTR